MIGWLDGAAGASGDMLLGALVDVGVPLPVLQAAVDALGVEPILLRATSVTRAGLGATKVDVLVGAHTRAADQAPGADQDQGADRALRPDQAHRPDQALRPDQTHEADQVHGADQTHGASAAGAAPATRTWTDVQALLHRAALDDPVRDRALAVFAALAHAEGSVHRVDPGQVHFHEVGALDALADVVGAAAGLSWLGLSALHCSTLSLGSGRTRGAHGPLPVPVPAVLALLAGCPVTAGAAPYEMTTPTGAALLASSVTSWGSMPAMTVQSVGSGAGGRDPDEVANVLRLVLGEPLATPPPADVVLETNVDDLDPRLWPGVIAALLAAGASDAWLTPVLMKKGRPAHTLSVLCPAGRAAGLREVVFDQTSAIGLREIPVRKHALARSERTVHVDGRPVRVKTAWRGGVAVNVNPEWADVEAAAAALGRPAKTVLELARVAALAPHP